MDVLKEENELNSEKKTFFSENDKIIFKVFLRFFLISTCLIFCVFTFWIHCRLTNSIPACEYSFTEILQELLLFIDVVLFGIIAHKNKSLKESAILAGCFTACMFVRELDFLFDYVSNYLWKILVFAIVIAAFSLTFRKTGLKTTVSSLVNLTKADGFVEIFYGLLIVLIISRLMGMNIVWLFTDNINYDFYMHKRFVEETLELCGYCLYTIGVASILIKTSNESNNKAN